MKKRTISGIFLLCALIISFGCGPTVVSVSVVRPAQVDLEGIDKIMIGGISGRGGNELAKSLSITIANHPHYTLLDDAYFKGLMAKGYTVEFGGTAFIQGNISKHIYTEKMTEEVVDKPQGKKETRYRKTGTAEVEATLKVIDPNSGAVLGMRHLRKTAVATVRSVNEKPRAINKNSLLSSARNQIVGEFMKLIVPYRERIGLTFAEEKNIPEMEGAIQIVKAGQWEPAIAEYRRIAETYASTPGVNTGPAYFNIGLCQIVLKQYDAAIESFNQAMRFSPALANRAGYEISKVKRLQSDIERLKKQMEGSGSPTTVTVVKKPEPVPIQEKPATEPERKAEEPAPLPSEVNLKGNTAWISGGVQAKLVNVADVSADNRAVFGMPVQLQSGFKLVAVRGTYTNLTKNFKNYAVIKMSSPQLPEITLATDAGKTYFRSMHTIGLMPPFAGLKPEQEYNCWTVFEIPVNEKPEKLMGIVNGKTQIWDIMN